MLAPLIFAFTSVFVGAETPLTQTQPLVAQGDPIVTFAGNAPIVVWRDSALRSGVFGGQPVADVDVSTLRESADISGLAAASSGDQVLVVWLEGGHVSSIRLGSDGRPLAPTAAIEANDGARLVAVASSNDRLLVTWVNDSNAIMASIVGRDGSQTSPLVINSPVDRVLTLAAASNGSAFFVVWSTGHIQAMAISPVGTPRTTKPIAIDAAEVGNWPAVAWSGREYLVAWSGAGLRAQRFSAEGTPNGDIVRISASDSLLGDSALVLVWDGAGFVLAALRFLGYRDPNFLSYVTAIRLTADGLPAELLLTSDSTAIVTRPSDFAIAAHDGHLVLGYAFGTTIAVRSAVLGAPLRLRLRAMRP
jgi:hypothetical protein